MGKWNVQACDIACAWMFGKTLLRDEFLTPLRYYK
jgi:hypothetical protein